MSTEILDKKAKRALINKKYYEANKEKLIEQSKQKRLADPLYKEKKAVSNKKYYETHKEKVFEACYKWKKDHKDDPKLKEGNRLRSQKYYSDEEKREKKKERMRERYYERKLEQQAKA